MTRRRPGADRGDRRGPCPALFVNARNEIVGEAVVADGTVDRAPVLPRRVVGLAVERKAGGVILAHNHPTGTPHPFDNDDLLTRRLRAAADAVDPRFIDPPIVTPEGFYSYRREAPP